MSGTKLIRWSGCMAALGGIFMAAYMLIHPWAQRTGDIATTPQWFVSHAFHLVGAVLMVLGLFGLYLRQREATGKPGLFSFLVAYLGTVLFVATGFTSTFWWPAIAQDAPSFVVDGGPMFKNWLTKGSMLAARVFLVRKIRKSSLPGLLSFATRKAIVSVGKESSISLVIAVA